MSYFWIFHHDILIRIYNTKLFGWKKGEEEVYKRFRSLVAVVMAAAVTVSGTGLTVPVKAADSAPTAFEEAFQNPDNDAKPFVRWWIAPGRMSEEEVRKEMKNFADGGYGGVELQSLEMAKNCRINDTT